MEARTHKGGSCPLRVWNLDAKVVLACDEVTHLKNISLGGGGAHL